MNVYPGFIKDIPSMSAYLTMGIALLILFISCEIVKKIKKNWRKKPQSKK